MGEEDTTAEVADKQNVTEKREGRSQEVKEMEEAKNIKPGETDKDPKVDVKEVSRDENCNVEGTKDKEDNQADAIEVETPPRIKGSTMEKNEERVDDSDQDKGGEEKAVEIDRGLMKPERKSLEGEFKEMTEKVEEDKKPEEGTPASNRPIRERKPVERLVASIGTGAVKEVQIEKGQGTPLKDIPKVASKLSRKKYEDILKQLHSILFGRRVKGTQTRSNIAEFSGFVWHGDEEKQRIKVMEKFNKFSKEKLLEFFDLLDIPIPNATTTKEDIVKVLIDFLVAPQATTTELVTEKEKPSKGTKRKRALEHSSTNSEGVRLMKSQKRSDILEKQSACENKGELEGEKEVDKMSESLEEKKCAADSREEKEDEKNKVDEKETGPERKPEDDAPGHFECEEKNVSKDDEKKHKRNLRTPPGNKKSPENPKSNQGKGSKKSSPEPKKTPRNPSSRNTKVRAGSLGSQTDPSKNKNVNMAKEESLSNGAKSKPLLESPSSEKAVNEDFFCETLEKSNAKKRGRPKKETPKPTDTELRDAICKILKEVDINTTTLADVMRQLAEQFNTDLMPRKKSIKLMLQEEYSELNKNTGT